ncbi:MAG: DNA polymerase III subunit beta [bacterium]
MKFSCTQENLHQGLEIVSRASGKNAALPILSNILISAESTSVRLTATNLEIGISCLVRGKVESEGAYTVQSRLLNEFVSLLPGDRIDVGTENESLKLKTDQTQTTIKGLPAEEFPLIPKIEKINPIKIDPTELKRAISQVIFAAAQDNTRPEINGVYLEIKDKELIMAATDSYRLSEKKIALENTKEPKKAIIPTRALQELLRILDNEAGQTILYITENQLLACIGDIELVSRLIEGQYPDYSQIIPQEAKTTATLPVAELTRIIKAASLFCKTGINDINIKLEPGKRITINTANTQVGEHATGLEGDIVGQPSACVFNYRYLLDGLGSIETEDVILEITDSESPGLLKPTNKQPHQYLIMPIRQ